MILAGDIGGTNARFGCYVAGRRTALVELRTGEYETATELLSAARQALPDEAPEICCLALAGPVWGDRAQLTNAPGIALSRRALLDSTGARQACLVNDMVAVGSAVAELPGDSFELLGGVPGAGVKGIVAAGTGLGMAIITGNTCLPSQGGHARVAPVGAFERELLSVTEAEMDGGIVAWEHYLSGRGIETLYRTVCTVWGAKPRRLSSAQITRQGLTAEDPVCHTTLETWAVMLATAAGGLAVTALTLGGIYLGGGIPPALADLLRAPSFRRRFEEAAWAAEFLTRIPVYLITDPSTGLDGAHIIATKAGRS